MSTKRVVIGLGVVIAIGLGFASFKGIIAPKSGVEGTIGAAKRYQATQISAGDVKLEDADIQDLLQSDLFHQLVTDANFREMLHTQSETFRAVMMDKKFRDLLGKEGFAEVMRSDLFKKAVEQNRYDILEKATEADFRRTQLIERTPTLDRTNTTDLGARRTAEQLRTQVTLAREELARKQAEYDRSVATLLKVDQLAAKADVQARVEAAKTQDVMARQAVAQRTADYERNLAQASQLAKTSAATVNRQEMIAKVEASRAELAKAEEALGKTTAAYQLTVSELSKLSAVAARQDMLGKVEASRAGTLEAKSQVGSAMQAYDRQISTALHVDLERASKAESYARAQALARSEAFRAVFADAQFRELAKSDHFARLATLDRFEQVAKMNNFQRAVSNADVWKQVVAADVERSATVR